jgi:hypothetical protein
MIHLDKNYLMGRLQKLNSSSLRLRNKSQLDSSRFLKNDLGSIYQGST